MSNEYEWKILKTDSIPTDLLVGNYEFRFYMGKPYNDAEYQELSFHDYNIVEYLSQLTNPMFKGYNTDRYQYRLSDIPKEAREKKLHDELMSRKNILGYVEDDILKIRAMGESNEKDNN